MIICVKLQHNSFKPRLNANLEVFWPKGWTISALGDISLTVTEGLQLNSYTSSNKIVSNLDCIWLFFHIFWCACEPRVGQFEPRKRFILFNMPQEGLTKLIICALFEFFSVESSLYAMFCASFHKYWDRGHISHYRHVLYRIKDHIIISKPDFVLFHYVNKPM